MQGLGVFGESQHVSMFNLCGPLGQSGNYRLSPHEKHLNALMRRTKSSTTLLQVMGNLPHDPTSEWYNIRKRQAEPECVGLYRFGSGVVSPTKPRFGVPGLVLGFRLRGRELRMKVWGFFLAFAWGWWFRVSCP